MYTALDAWVIVGGFIGVIGGLFLSLWIMPLGVAVFVIGLLAVVAVTGQYL